MKYLDVRLPTPAENLALDEALLERAVASAENVDVFRLWECDAPAVVIGRASRIRQEVELEYCEANKIPVLRRCSGGLAVVLGPGCLMYSVVLTTQNRPELTVVDRCHEFVLGQTRAALASLAVDVSISGTSDLALGNRKCSGNSLRCKREAVLYHGTLLYDASIELISRCLSMPPRAPDYREKRSHADFLTNLPVDAASLKRVLTDVWQCECTLDDWPRQETADLVRQKYLSDDWNFSR